VGSRAAPGLVVACCRGCVPGEGLTRGEAHLPLKHDVKNKALVEWCAGFFEQLQHGVCNITAEATDFVASSASKINVI